MATPAAAPAEAPKGGGNKKLIIIIAAVLVLVLGGGGAALLLMKKKPPADDEEGGDAAASHQEAPAHAAPKPGTPPVFVPLDPFTVNLSDKDVDRFAQVGITLEVIDAKTADQIKAYLPAIRSNVLMVLSHKTSVELLSREGKEKLAKEVLRESVRPMGIELDDEDEHEEDTAPKKKKKKKKPAVVSPVTQVLFSTFIVQ
ncbi:flagellar basal body-associated FliL family protein [Paucibacter sp. DJ2R-2]|uniref:flagellar basal body-associated FliL family protein n=1 Tax=Paucibacter sp. DJ2R-2 TaxID=2893558 RepID=UPI0021E36F61|nr:flagellar basal body-associated FliL family protein [Paucibacter sp. DJ2R-2]MCV2423283.1 flagellar basal body-associated FliL family protein [Paucibacter sp. DJ4R-1]MCV2441498.1 flagellar basal body-associated FliL family protein [Paucibacter sp. DJ2R-2]